MPSETAEQHFRRHFFVPRFVFIMAEGINSRNLKPRHFHKKQRAVGWAVGWASAHQSHQFHRIKGFWGIGVIRRFRFPAALMDLTESVGMVGLVILE
ncbi:hypothetical protein [Neisseria polysaccharea]